MVLYNAKHPNTLNISANKLLNNYFPKANLSPVVSYVFLPASAILFLIGIFANIFVITIIIKCRRMRTLTNRFLLNLAVSDLLATLVCVPPTAYNSLEKRWIFGEFLCRFFPFIQGTSIAVSIFTLTAVSIDRFIAIHKPIHTRLFCTSFRIIIIISIIWITSFLVMIPLIIHQKIVDPLNIKSAACSEDWHQNMNARLIYDFTLLSLLFILPLAIITYCYIRISYTLWFIDSNIRASISSASSKSNLARFSVVSEDIQRININDLRRSSLLKNRKYYRNDNSRMQNIGDNRKRYDFGSLTNISEAKLKLNQTKRSTTTNDIKTKSCSITTPVFGSNLLCRRSTSLVGRRGGEKGSFPICIQQSPLNKQSLAHRQQGNGIIRFSLTSLQSQNRIFRSTSLSTNGANSHNRSIADIERATRFLQSRRRVVKLLIILIIVFFVTRLPVHILNIYIDITSNTYLPDSDIFNRTSYVKPLSSKQALQSHVSNSQKKMAVVLDIYPILQLFSLSNSAINPLCYCIMSHAIKNLILLMRQKFHRRSQKRSGLIPLIQRPNLANQAIKIIKQNHA